MTVSVRKFRPEDAKALLEIHHSAVREVAARDYPPAIVDAWAPMPITEAAIARVAANAGGETRFMAEFDGRPAGIGTVVFRNHELRACYVAAWAVRRGVGTALVRTMERAGRDNGLAFLQLNASLTAELFYVRLGYTALGRTEHVLPAGQPMTCIKMRKALTA